MAIRAQQAALRAQPPHQALGQHAQQRGRQREGLDAHVDQARSRRWRVVGVQRRQHQVAGERGLDGDLAVSKSRISPIMMTSGSWRRMARRALGKGEVDLGVDLRLTDAGQLVLDRVLDRQHVARGGVHGLQAA